MQWEIVNHVTNPSQTEVCIISTIYIVVYKLHIKTYKEMGGGILVVFCPTSTPQKTSSVKRLEL